MESPYYGMFLEGTGYYFLRGVVWRGGGGTD